MSKTCVINGVMYEKKNIAGYGDCFILKKESLTERIINAHNHVVEVGTFFDGSKIAVQICSSQYLVLIWDTHINSYRAYTPYMIFNDLDKCIQWLEANITIKY